MVREKEMTYRFRTVCVRLAFILLTLLFACMIASPGTAYAAKDTGPEEPIREVHNVGVGNEAYCFFVTHNVVLTPAEVAGMSDEELISAILDRAGLYMIKANCKAGSHKIITVQDWTKKDRVCLLSTTDIDAIRSAAPVDGAPVKFYMDLIVSDGSGSDKDAEEGEEAEEKPLYSTYKKTSPRLLFAVVATEEDAKLGEDICVEKATREKTPRIGRSDAPAEDMLPEYRTINMVDRSGAPIEETLVDGDPVTLEWIEPKDIGKEEGRSFFDLIPGGAAGFAVIAAALAAAIAAIIIAARKKRTDE